MANMRIIHSNLIDGAANMASTPACATAMPITNLKNPLRGSFARIVGATTWAITGEISGVCSGMALVGHNLTGGATVRLRLYSDFAKTTQIYDSTALTIWTPQVWGDPAASPNGGLSWGVLPWNDNGQVPGTSEYYTLWFTPVLTAVAFTLDIVDAGNSDGFLQLGRVYLGEYWSPSVNVSYGLSMAWKEASKQTRSDGNSLRTEGYLPYRIYSGRFDAMAEADRAAFIQILRKVGLRLDMLVSFAPGVGGAEERDYTAAVKFTQLPKMDAAFYSIYESSAELEEI